MTDTKKRFFLGVQAGLPVILGFIPVGIAYAIMARQAGFTVGQTVGMSAAVFAGASQMMVIGMYTQGASIIAMILATLILNLRHVIMGTCIFNRMRGVKTSWKLLSAYGVTDEGFAVFTTLPENRCTFSFYLGLTVVSYLSWVAGSAIGAVTSDFLPAIITASLGIALYAMFLGLLIPNLTHNWKLGVLVIFTAVCNSLLSQCMDSSWALILSTLVCAGIGVFFVDLEEEKA